MSSAPLPPPALPCRLLPFLWHFARKRCWGLLFLLIFPSLGAAVQASYGHATRQITDAALEASRAGADMWLAAQPALLFFAALVSSSLFIRLIQWTAGYKTRMPFAADIRRAVFAHVQRHEATWFEKHLAGKITHKTATLPEQTMILLERFCYDLLPSFCFLVAAIIYLFTAHLFFAVILAAWLALYFTIISLLSRSIASAARAHSDSKTRLTGQIMDVLTNIRAVIANAAHRHEDSLLRGAVDEVRARHGAFYLNMVRMRFGQNTLNILIWIALYASAVYAWSRQHITAGDFVMITSLGALVVNRAYEVAEMLPDYLDNMASAQESLDTLVFTDAHRDAAHATDLAVTRGEIRFENLHFAYPDGATVFKGLSLVIPPGQRVGLIGTSGAGKTTLTSLLLRQIAPDRGRILIDGQDLAAVRQESLRRQIALIPQDTALFHRTIEDNILYGRPDATPEEVHEAARKAWCLDFIGKLPQGAATLLGERGVRLSGGQRQRLAIARAFLKNAPILLLDEATSALDSESEAVIQAAMAEAMKGRTVIAIAHRLSTIAHLDRLIVLADGRIAEDGSHVELIARRGLYASLWQRQSGGFLLEDSGEPPAPSPASGDAGPEDLPVPESAFVKNPPVAEARIPPHDD